MRSRHRRVRWQQRLHVLLPADSERGRLSIGDRQWQAGNSRRRVIVAFTAHRRRICYVSLQDRVRDIVAAEFNQFEAKVLQFYFSFVFFFTFRCFLYSINALYGSKSLLHI